MPHDLTADFIALQAALAGEYSLECELGRGGTGIVYLAREVRLSRPVAIKILPAELTAQSHLRAAFLREAQTAAGLTHPNIVNVYAAGERGGYAYIVMAFVQGTTLGERIRTRGPLLPGQAARVLREVAWALAYAHGAGIVHGDVSAENILLERGSERAIVMDFGLASAMQSSARSHDGRVMGNAHYVSPEQAVGEPLDARSDLYSLGVVGFYALTGRLPFNGGSSAEVVTQHLTTPAPTITSVAAAVPPRLANAVQRCLHKDPIRRYRNAESFAEAIDLAFEHAKEIPAPLRVWLNQGERELPARSEEIEYERRQSSGWFRRAMRVMFGASLGTSALGGYLGWQQSAMWELGTIERSVLERADTFVYGTIFLSLSALTFSGVALGGEFVRLRLASRLAAMSIAFWKGPWGARVARLASIGSAKAARPVLGMPLLTEVALGRATDHLFDALPKTMRRELAVLPDTVRRLEADAGKLRQSIDVLDAQLAMFERGGDALVDEKRSGVADSLHGARSLAAERLSATVTAIENIRLDLLRLQIGSAGIESVTASHEYEPESAVDDDDADTPTNGVPALHV
ncbi:MAG: serine/threonine protein kinase [Gemmatimonadaceae bacterium]|nr:serine/threonine protein kinase [Gemmatimonadaceae bacterium]